MKSLFLAAHWPGDFDERALQKWTEELRAKLGRSQSVLGLVFMSSEIFAQALKFSDPSGSRARRIAGWMLQSQSHSQWREIEEEGGLVLGLYICRALSLRPSILGSNSKKRPRITGGSKPESLLRNPMAGCICRSFPFGLRVMAQKLEQSYAPLPVVGGLASGDFSEQSTQVYLNGEAFPRVE